MRVQDPTGIQWKCACRLQVCSVSAKKLECLRKREAKESAERPDHDFIRVASNKNIRIHKGFTLVCLAPEISNKAEVSFCSIADMQCTLWPCSSTASADSKEPS